LVVSYYTVVVINVVLCRRGFIALIQGLLSSWRHRAEAIHAIVYGCGVFE